MKKPHKHAELIKAWADGAEIEYRDRCSNIQVNAWSPLPPQGDWDDHPDFEYRIKPEPKPDFEYVFNMVQGEQYMYGVYFRSGTPNIKLTFDGKTGKLKSAEVL